MTYTEFRRTAALLSLAGLWLSIHTVYGQDDLTKLLTRLKNESLDPSALLVIEGHPHDPEILPALRTAFDRYETKREKQWIALTLLRLGDKSNKYFDYLAAYARKAIEDPAPYFESAFANGPVVQFSPAFENWCSEKHEDPKSVAAVQLAVYPLDVLYLARSQDPRAAKLLKTALDSSNPTVVAFAVQGLGRLQDFTAIPLIERASQRLPQQALVAIAMQLPWFGHLEADQLMERLMPDREQRDSNSARVRQFRTDEKNLIESRSGSAIQR
jgi:hypothetical protein